MYNHSIEGDFATSPDTPEYVLWNNESQQYAQITVPVLVWSGHSKKVESLAITRFIRSMFVKTLAE